MNMIYDFDMDVERPEEYYIVDEDDGIVDRVVFCEDCRFYGTDGNPHDWCECNGCSFPATGYCSYGEFKEV